MKPITTALVYPNIKKIKEGDWRYEATNQSHINFIPLPSEPYRKVEHKFFTLHLRSLGKSTAIIKPGYRWNGADVIPDLIESHELIIPSLVHDIFCQATAENLLPWRPYRKYGDQVFASIYTDIMSQAHASYRLRRFIMYRAIRLNSIIKGLSY